MKRPYKTVLFSIILPYTLILIIAAVSILSINYLKNFQNRSIKTLYLWKDLKSYTDTRFRFSGDTTSEKWNEKFQLFDASLTMINEDSPGWLFGENTKDQINKTLDLWIYTRDILKKNDLLHNELRRTHLGEMLLGKSFVEIVKDAYMPGNQNKEEISFIDFYNLNKIDENVKDIMEFVFSKEFFETRLYLLNESIDEIVNALVNLVFIAALLVSLIIIFSAMAYLRYSQARQKKNEENLSIILNSIGDAMIAVSNDSTIIRMNPVAEKLTGWKFKNAEGSALSSVFKIIDEQTGEETKSPVTTVLQSQKIVNLSERNLLISREGEQYNISTSGAPITNTDGEILGVVLVFRDITRRKQHELEVHHLRNYLSNIINSMPSVLVGVDIDGKVTQWNKTAEQTTGIAAAAAQGKNLTEVLPQMISKMEKITESIKTGQTKQEQKKPRKSDKGTSYEDVTIYPLITNGVEGAVIRIDDVTDKVQLEAQLRHSQKMDAVGQLAGGIAHDFNNMLGGILGAAQLLKASGKDWDSSELELVEMIDTSAQRAADLTLKLLMFSRKSKNESASMNLHTIIKDAAALLRRSLDKKIKLRIDLKAIVDTVQGNNSQLQNSIMNMCINASHAMPDGGDILISTRNIDIDETYCKVSPFDISPGSFIEIEIRDTGTGIPNEILEKIFDPFFTTKEQGKGTGLGLSTVYGIIKNHNGSITVYSEQGVGTAFHIYLPLSSETVHKKDEETVTHGTGTILLIDDERIIRFTAKAILKELGYDVIMAKNGRAGVELFKKEKPRIDLVILDMIMPIMNGREAFMKMKEIDEHVKIILSSGFSKSEDLAELEKRGLSGFIRKPYRKSELSQIVAKVMERSN